MIEEIIKKATWLDPYPEKAIIQFTKSPYFISLSKTRGEPFQEKLVKILCAIITQRKTGENGENSSLGWVGCR